MVRQASRLLLEGKPAKPAALAAPEQLVRPAESADTNDPQVGRIEGQPALAAGICQPGAYPVVIYRTRDPSPGLRGSTSSA
jgi:hypothetical protein